MREVPTLAVLLGVGIAAVVGLIVLRQPAPVTSRSHKPTLVELMQQLSSEGLGSFLRSKGTDPEAYLGPSSGQSFGDPKYHPFGDQAEPRVLVRVRQMALMSPGNHEERFLLINAEGRVLDLFTWINFVPSPEMKIPRFQVEVVQPSANDVPTIRVVQDPHARESWGNPRILLHERSKSQTIAIRWSQSVLLAVVEIQGNQFVFAP